MRTYNVLTVQLSQEEKNTLREAAEIVKEIVDLLANNKEQGFTPWQEGLKVIEAFWELKVNFKRIDDEELIP